MKRIFLLYTWIWACVAMVGAQPRFSSNIEHQNVGQIAWKHPVTVCYEISNTGNRPLVLTQVETSCACAVADWTKTPIAPGKKGQITATFDAEALGHFMKDVMVYTNAEPHMVYLTFGGEVVTQVTDCSRTHPFAIGDIRLDKDELIFPDVCRGEKSSVEFSVVNLSDKPYTPVLMHLPSYLKMESEFPVLQKGQQGQIRLILDTDEYLGLGLNKTSVYLSRFEGDKVGVENAIPVSVILLPNFKNWSDRDRAYAPKTHLSEVRVNLSDVLLKKRRVHHDIVVTNTGKGVLDIKCLQVFHPSLRVSLKKSSLAPGESTRLRISIVRTLIPEDKVSLKLLMITNDPEHPKSEVDIRVRA